MALRSLPAGAAYFTSSLIHGSLKAGTSNVACYSDMTLIWRKCVLNLTDRSYVSSFLGVFPQFLGITISKSHRGRASVAFHCYVNNDAQLASAGSTLSHNISSSSMAFLRIHPPRICSLPPVQYPCWSFDYFYIPFPISSPFIHTYFLNRVDPMPRRIDLT
jgi:hypothetical protein